jgi:hypothetical protein
MTTPAPPPRPWLRFAKIVGIVVLAVVASPVLIVILIMKARAS